MRRIAAAVAVAVIAVSASGCLGRGSAAPTSTCADTKRPAVGLAVAARRRALQAACRLPGAVAVGGVRERRVGRSAGRDARDQPDAPAVGGAVAAVCLQRLCHRGVLAHLGRAESSRVDPAHRAEPGGASGRSSQRDPSELRQPQLPDAVGRTGRTWARPGAVDGRQCDRREQRSRLGRRTTRSPRHSDYRQRAPGRSAPCARGHTRGDQDQRLSARGPEWPAVDRRLRPDQQHRLGQRRARALRCSRGRPGRSF